MRLSPKICFTLNAQSNGSKKVLLHYFSIHILTSIHFRTVSVDCMKTQTMIVDQMNAWDNEDCETKPDDDAPHGQKCLYKVSVFEFIL